MRLGDRDATFEVGTTRLTTRLIEGEFPNYRQLIPPSHPNALTVEREPLLEAIRRVKILAKDATPVKLQMGGDTLRLTAITQDVGNASEELDAQYSGTDLTVAFNPDYLMAGVEACQGDAVTLSTLDALKPAVLRGKGHRGLPVPADAGAGALVANGVLMPAPSVTVRVMRPARWSRPRGVRRALDEGGIAELLDLLRASWSWEDELAVVAEVAGEVAGEIAGLVVFTHSFVDAPDRVVDVLVLSPVGVRRDLQGRGIGDTLVREALAVLAATRTEPAVFLEGIPSYYPRFGFRLAADSGSAPSRASRRVHGVPAAPVRSGAAWRAGLCRRVLARRCRRAARVIVTRLELVDFRNYVAASFEFDHGITAVVGLNGQGKTNLAEALAYLATLDSFRGAPTEALIRVGADTAIVRATVLHPDGREVLVELELSRHGRNRVQVNKQRLARTRELLGVMRVTVFSPDDLALVKGAPSERRRFLDDTLVALALKYDALRLELDRILKQRNTLLKQANGRLDADSELTLDVWDGEVRRGR